MAIKITGIEEMMKRVEKSVSEVVNKEVSTLDSASKIVFREVLNGILYYKDTGATVSEMKITKTRYENGLYVKRIYWEGPKKRYRLIHLNEHGYTRKGKRYTPRGYGRIALALRRAEEPYFNEMKRSGSR